MHDVRIIGKVNPNPNFVFWYEIIDGLNSVQFRQINSTSCWLSTYRLDVVNDDEEVFQDSEGSGDDQVEMVEHGCNHAFAH